MFCILVVGFFSGLRIFGEIVLVGEIIRYVGFFFMRVFGGHKGHMATLRVEQFDCSLLNNAHRRAHITLLVCSVSSVCTELGFHCW